MDRVRDSRFHEEAQFCARGARTTLAPVDLASLGLPFRLFVNSADVGLQSYDLSHTACNEPSPLLFLFSATGGVDRYSPPLGARRTEGLPSNRRPRLRGVADSRLCPRYGRLHLARTGRLGKGRHIWSGCTSG